MSASVKLETDFIRWGHFCWQVTCLKMNTILASGGGHPTEKDAQIGGLEFIAGARGRQEAEKIGVDMFGAGWVE